VFDLTLAATYTFFVSHSTQEGTKGDQTYFLLPPVAGVCDHVTGEFTDLRLDVGSVFHVSGQSPMKHLD
jgi:hypothetical protein